MKILKNRRLVYIFLTVVIIVVSVLPVIVSENAAITFNSVPALVFGVCSLIYAVIAFLSKDRGNLFVFGKNKLFFAFLRWLSDDRPDTDSDEYKKEFALSAFIFCASIPLYIPLAFFAKNFYTALSSTLSVTILRILLTFVFVLITHIIKNAKNKKRDRIKDEADKKDQERRESMGKWK